MLTLWLRNRPACCPVEQDVNPTTPVRRAQRDLRLLLVPVVIALLGAITACQSAAAPLTVNDPYVKAAAAGEMTAIFGVLHNTTGSDLTVTSASTDVATTVELHEMVMDNGRMVMRPRAGGFVVPANGNLALEPGGLHIMLIGLKKALAAGDQVSATLTLSDGRTITLSATVRDMANAKESYHPSASSTGH